METVREGLTSRSDPVERMGGQLVPRKLYNCRKLELGKAKRQKAGKTRQSDLTPKTEGRGKKARVKIGKMPSRVGKEG